VVDWEALRRRVPELREEYLPAKPWSHVVIEGIFPDALLDAAVDELRDLDRSGMDEAHTSHMVKRETADEHLLGPATRQALALLNGPELLEVVSGITGIDGLTADDDRQWAGVHETPPGGFTKVHCDFVTHPKSGLFHRSNVLLYLNREWHEEWGGALELWPPDMRALGRRIQPRANTLVIFETHAGTLHGLPQPVATPDGRSRFSLAAYQYATTPQPKGRRLAKYAARPEDSWRVGIPTWWDIKDRIPQPVRNAASTLRRAVQRVAR
jgi:hypothetical protein